MEYIGEIDRLAKRIKIMFCFIIKQVSCIPLMSERSGGDSSNRTMLIAQRARVSL